jgi:hypothetical protein
LLDRYEGRVGITQERQVSSISIELHTNRENIMKNMNQQPAEKSSDRQYLTFLTGVFQVSYTYQGDDIWWASLQQKQAESE